MKSKRLAMAMIGVTALACAAALWLRTPIRARYWAAQVVRLVAPAEQQRRAAYVQALCNAGDAGRWGTSMLLDHPDSEIRSLGAIILHRNDSPWSRRRLAALLNDPDTAVRELAAVGLAAHGDDSIIPQLRAMYSSQDAISVRTACVALERLATPAAIATLIELSQTPAPADSRAMLIDALDGIGNAECVAPLVYLLTDHRPTQTPTRASQLAAGALSGFGQLPEGAGFATARFADDAPGGTVAERAAAALRRITELTPEFSSDLPEPRRLEAARIWTSWRPDERGERTEP